MLSNQVLINQFEAHGQQYNFSYTYLLKLQQVDINLVFKLIRKRNVGEIL